MDELKVRLQQLKLASEKLAAESNAIMKEYDAHDLLQENLELKQQLKKVQADAGSLKKRQTELTGENRKLRIALQEQMMDEKMNLLMVSREKLQTYFSESAASGKNRLKEWEAECKGQMDAMKLQAERELKQEAAEMLQEMEELKVRLSAQIHAVRLKQRQREQTVLAEMDAQHEKLKEEPLSEEMMQKRMKQNQIEMKIGLSWINKIGILLIILGVAAAFQYSYANWFNDYFKGGAFFLLGAIMLAGGEWFYRNNRKTFALGLIGGGISVLYGSIFFSYFLLGILGMIPALLLSVLVTGSAVLLSLRYASRTVCTFGLAGGYIPLYSYLAAFQFSQSAIYPAMVYLLLLNVLILMVSFKKQWRVVQYISFGLNMPSMLLLIGLAENHLISICFALITFILYLGLTVSYPFVHKAVLHIGDTILLALNTVISCSVMYWLFSELDWNHLRGILAIVFCLVYFGLGRFAEKSISNEKQTRLLFYGTSLAFAVLVIPFQFGVQWLSLGWLAEAVILIIYGLREKAKQLERAGWVIFLLCLAVFYFESSARLIGTPVLSYSLKYFAITAALLLAAVYYPLVRKRTGFFGIFEKLSYMYAALKYFSLLNLWFYLLYEAQHLYLANVPKGFEQFWFYLILLEAFLTAGLAYILQKVRILYDQAVQYYSLFLYAAGSFTVFCLTAGTPVLKEPLSDNGFFQYLALLLLICFNVLVFFVGRDVILAFAKRFYQSGELYPVVLAVYLLGVMAAFLTVQFRLGFSGFAFSIIMLLTAAVYIFYGFRKKLVYVRRLGLGVTLLSTAKLFIFDLAFLEEASKIAAYFCFGLALLGISFIYQKVSSKQEDSVNVSQD
ncbi:DUF2339 domain-containing protein [Metabacillus sp. GX 13764]|uniref:DUF2339 domain-containing protein n=1 Tax=Metabacillus kandeliae TaxID=2900151 RepID=UPI001E44F508|nr:DUF2339 domain-containing protein [Metabacillus kandeliae]MCD7035414.1 DUF2339 domain-containing protein [Metabacillus kandeliae]